MTALHALLAPEYDIIHVAGDVVAGFVGAFRVLCLRAEGMVGYALGLGGFCGVWGRGYRYGTGTDNPYASFLDSTIITN